MYNTEISQYNAISSDQNCIHVKLTNFVSVAALIAIPKEKNLKKKEKEK